MKKCPNCHKEIQDDAVKCKSCGHLLLDATPPKELALSLSGGGHRAALYGLGVLLALVDRGLNTRVKQIASVSGGSIVNGFIATHCKFDGTRTEVFDEVAAKLVHIIVHKGVLTWKIIVALIGGILVPPLLFIWLGWHNFLTWRLATLLVVAWLGTALLRGLVIEWLIEMRYFPPSVECKLFPPKLKILRQRLGDLHDRSVDHALCCTDLLEPGPVHFSSQSVGRQHGPGSFYSGVDNQTKWMVRCASPVPIASAVRASAAFPGIPPRLIRFKSRLEDVAGHKNLFGGSLYDPTPHLQKTMVLADGGIWNNLGTQVARESNWIPLGQPDRALIIADASVPLASQRVIPYCIPVWALIRSLRRVANVQHENTVEPRLDQISRHSDRFMFVGGRIAESRLDALAVELGLSEEQRKVLIELNDGGYLSNEKPWDFLLRLEYRPDVPLHWYRAQVENVPAMARKLGAVMDKRLRGAELFDLARIDFLRVGTHLGRIRDGDAKGLLARGYLNAIFLTVGLKPLGMEDIDHLVGVPQRLEEMVKG